ncbi:MAG: single-stranded-DNA-specific exonuclease RecJ [Bacillota bacterium]
MTDNMKIWRLAKEQPVLREIFAQKLGVPPIVAQILANRGILTLDEARIFLNGDFSHLHDPFLLKDMDRAVERINRALAAGEKIVVYGDYDADGITSTALLLGVLREMGADAGYYIPSRMGDGYGLSVQALEMLADRGVSLVVTVDCGVSAAAEVAFALERGIDVVVTDHHEPPEGLPPAVAVINPKRRDCGYPFKELAGVGVAFKLAQALTGARSDAGAGVPGRGIPLPEILQRRLDIVALGTVADIVPLQGENRILVKGGLAQLSNTCHPGLQALLKVSGLAGKPLDATRLAFGLAPRLNAAGRVGDPGMAAELLLTADQEQAAQLAKKLDKANDERQAVEARIFEQAVEMTEAAGLAQNRVLVLAQPGWHVGVIGIVAARLVQKYYRPAVLLSIEEGTAKGSARSIPGFNIFEALSACSSLLVKYGGHNQAAGLTLEARRIDEFYAALEAHARESMADEQLIRQVAIDGEVCLTDLNCELYGHLERLAPFGCQNPGPVLVSRGTMVLDCRNVGADGSHLKMRLQKEQCVLDAIGFGLSSHPGLKDAPAGLDVAFALERNEWNDRVTLQLNVKDLKPSHVPDNPFATGEAAACAAAGSIPGAAAGGSTTGATAAAEGAAEFLDELFSQAPELLVDDYYRDIGERDEFYTKVVGVTFEYRQDIVRQLHEGEKLNLVRESDNAHDPNAIRVERSDGSQVGYLNARLARNLAPYIDQGEQYLTLVSQVTGGDDRSYGVNIVVQKVTEADRAARQQELRQVRNRLRALPDDALLEQIRAALLGSYEYREKQREALDCLFEGFNTLAIFGTGRGKSAVFQTMAAYKALRGGELTVILYPLRALANDQYEAMAAKFAPLGLRVCRGNGSLSAAERAELFGALETGEIDILLTTPEFISHHLDKIWAMPKKIGFLVADESHHIGAASTSHRPAYKKLDRMLEQLGGPLVLAVTATAGEEVADEIVSVMKIEKVVVDPHVRENLQLVDKRDVIDKNGYIRDLVWPGDKTIVYVNSRLKALELALYLRESVPHLASRISFYHAGLNHKQRATVEKLFRTGELAVVVTTSAFGEGIDIPDVRHVVLYHLNYSYTEFNQQSGRAGRNGEKAEIHLLCGRRDLAINRFILDAAAPDREFLSKLYLILKERAKRQHPVEDTNDELARALQKAGIRNAKDSAVSAGIGILEELALLQREIIGRERKITLCPPPGEKIELESSLRYMEGQQEKECFDEFQALFFRAEADTLLELVNRPIYPEKYL